MEEAILYTGGESSVRRALRAKNPWWLSSRGLIDVDLVVVNGQACCSGNSARQNLEVMLEASERSGRGEVRAGVMAE